MKPACLRQTELPSSSKLFTDFLYHYDRVTPYYGSGAGRVGFAEERRPDLVNALRELNGDSPSIQRLAQAGTVAVVTGQQVGLFSGPAYTIYKALTAARHAEVLTQMGTPAVPVFWLATEDHDFAEVSHAWIFDGQHRPAGLQVTGGDDVTPAGVVAPPAWPLRELRQALAGHPFTDEVVDTVSEAYQPGSSMGSAFHDLLRRLLAPYGFCLSIRSSPPSAGSQLRSCAEPWKPHRN